MRSYTTFVLLVLAASLPAEPPKAPDVKDELKKFQGAWVISVAEQDGR
jgi:hypothetical protein